MKIEKLESNPDRIAKLLEDFARKYELPCKIESSKMSGQIGVHESGKIIQMKFIIDSCDAYQFVAVLRKVPPEETSRLAQSIITSDPFRGITERIRGKKLTIFASRDGLSYLSNAQVQRLMMNDVARVANYFKFSSKL